MYVVLQFKIFFSCNKLGARQNLTYHLYEKSFDNM